MKKNKIREENLDKKKLYLGVSISLILISVITFMSVGFALYTQVINVNGTVNVKTDGDFAITNVVKISSSNTTAALPSFTNDSISLNLEFVKSNDPDAVYNATYDITVTNNTFFDQTIDNFDFNFSVNDQLGNPTGEITYTLTGIESGGMIDRLSEEVATLTVTFVPTVDQPTYPVDGEGTIDNTEKPAGNIVASLTGSTTGDIRSGAIASFTVTATSTYETNRTFHFGLGSSKIEVCNASGNTLSDFTINANSSDQTYTFYVKAKSGETFPNDTLTTSVTLFSTGLPNVSCGNITLQVDKEEVYVDTQAPTISGVSAVQSNEVGVVNLTWNGEDDYSGVDNYTVLVLDGDNNVTQTLHTTSDETEMNITGLANGTNASTYSFVVYGTDNEGNTASNEDISGANTSAGYASSSGQDSYQWTFTVTFNRTGANVNGANTVNIGQNYSCTFTAQNNYTLPNSITVTMGGTTLNNNQYTYTVNGNNASFSINSVTGNLVITITATGGGTPCIVEGSKVRLANNKVKNIEDITYDDLLLVFDHENGGLTYEYPIWMEQEHQKDYYQLTKFSDGTSLKTVGPHTVFNADTNRYMDITKIEEGTNIYKLDKNNKLYKVKVISKKRINKKIKYYDVVSTRYYNMFVDDVLTNDGREYLCNFYEFRENLLWSHRREEVIKNNTQLDYEDFNFVPYYLFYGLRAQDGAVLIKYNYINMTEFTYVFTGLLMNKQFIQNPNNILGKRIWSVSIDNSYYNRFFEGYDFTLPKNNKVKCYLNTSNNICYKPGSIVKIWTGTHFISKY